ncbi:MAG: hypothetical protein ACJ8J7_09810 [Sulfurifustaceae bacterium]
MDDYQTIARKRRLREIKEHAVAFLMLSVSLIALYLHEVYLAIIPLLWMAFRAGKEQGREEARRDIEQASALARLIQFPDDAPANRLTRFPRG